MNMSNEDGLLQCEITLTRSCNLRCYFCYTKRFGYNSNDIINYDDLKKIVDFCCDAKTKYIFFCGGEPLLYPNLNKILQYINKKQHCMYTAISTNGILLSDYNLCNKLVDNGIRYIDISMKGKDGVEWSNTTGLDGYLKQTKAIRNLSKLPIEFTCSMVITDESVYSICDRVKIALDNGAKQFSFTFFIDNNNSTITGKEYLFKNNPISLIDSFISQIDLLNSITKEWWVEYSFPMCIYTHKQLDLLNNKLALPCQVHLQNTVCFDTNLYLLPCSMFYEKKIGRLGVDFNSYTEFLEFKKSNIYKQVVSPLIELPSSECDSCSHLELCYGGCPVLWRNYSFKNLKSFLKNSKENFSI